MPWSDIDIVLFGDQIVDDELTFLSELSKIFQESPEIISTVKFLDKAQFPIIKLISTNQFQNIKIDITFKKEENSH